MLRELQDIANHPLFSRGKSLQVIVSLYILEEKQGREKHR
jgi:hypothetical protein